MTARRSVGRGVAALSLATLALASSASDAAAQIRGGRRPTTPARVTRPDTTRGRDSTGAPGDSTARRELVKWAEPDSVMNELSQRPGFEATKYQGETVVFDAAGRVLTLQGDSAVNQPAAVQRGQSLLVGLRVVYNDSLQMVRAIGNPAFGDTVVLRDPTQGSDVVALGHIQYDIANRRATVTNISTDVTSGERWIVNGKVGTFKSDSATDEKAFYVRSGSITSCDDPVPDYHFEAKEIKLVSKKVLVARPAVLYIADVPVMVLPFIFQDLRSGRRSGLLTPRFGVSELLRNSTSYRRHFENFGYYFALNDYMDAQTSVDWRSSAGGSAGDPGWVRLNGEWRYRWLDRFLTGRFAASHLREGDGLRNTALSWQHQQDFSSTSRLSANVNYVTSTTLQRQTNINYNQALATIQSQLSYSRKIGPFSLQAGGTRKQYPGRPTVDQTLPTISLTSGPLNVASWLAWTPTFNFTNSQNFGIEQPASANGFVFFPNGTGGTDSSRVRPNNRVTSLTFGTPLKIFGFDWSNSFTLNDHENTIPTNWPVEVPVRDANGVPLRDSRGLDSVVVSNRLYNHNYTTSVDWATGISLPALSQGKWNFIPSVSIVNVDPGPFWVRSQFSGGAFVHQSKRLQYGVSTAPTFFGLFPGFGPVSRFRHAISPSLRFDYAPVGQVSDEYLIAIGGSKKHDLTTLQTNRVSLGLSTNLEAKLRQNADTSKLNTDREYGGEARKLKVVSIQFSEIGYDFAKLRELRARAADPVRYPNAVKVGGFAGLSTDRFDTRFSSDLLPGFTLGTSYSLFQGNVISDTAVFKPYLENVNATLSLNQHSGVFAAFARMFGRAVPATTPGTAQVDQINQTRQDVIADQVAAQPVAGSAARNAQFNVPSGRGWQGSFTFTSQRQRPPVGNTSSVINLDPTRLCDAYRTQPAIFAVCTADPVTYLRNVGGIDAVDYNQYSTSRNSPIYRSPPQVNLGSNMSFDLTPHWSAAWGTQYDFRAKRFASQIVTLQRELHDWRAIFGFTKAPNGNFAFTFFISLNAQPELKFDYDRQSYRQQTSIP